MEEEIKENKKDEEMDEMEDEVEEVDETEEKEENPEKAEIEMLKQQLNELNQKVDMSKFARVETKPEFASEIVNTANNQKIANLETNEIVDLLDKRKFYNLLKNFKWDRLADRVLCNVRDVENYSLSQEGMLIKNVMTEQSKQATYSYNTQKSKRK